MNWRRTRANPTQPIQPPSTPIKTAGLPPPTSIRDSALRIAGGKQDDLRALGVMLACLLGRNEVEVTSHLAIPATGGPSVFQLHLGAGSILSSADKTDILIALTPEACRQYLGQLRDGGILLYDPNKFFPAPSPLGFRRITATGVPLPAPTIPFGLEDEAGPSRRDFFLLGLLAGIFNLAMSEVRLMIRERLGWRRESFLHPALLLAEEGSAHTPGDLMPLFSFETSSRQVRSG